MTTPIRPLVIIEAPGKINRLRELLRSDGIAADVWATRGHLYNNPASLWPVAIDHTLTETARIADPVKIETLKALSIGRTVLIATDPDDEGEVIARDVADAIAGRATVMRRVYLHALDLKGVRVAFRNTMPLRPELAVPGDGRRVLDRLLGAVFSDSGRPVGRVFSALLGVLANDPVIGHVTLMLEANDGGAPFVARVPVTPSTRAQWERRLADTHEMVVGPARKLKMRAGSWRYGDYLALAAGAPLVPSQLSLRGMT